ncbi:MAG: aspartate carbamoyltransferase [Nitrososphaerota archaeon]|jgi:aspartate carbamoyltransferase catalytic subunit|nr:aspartate carbamoyltransferase [Nitrososphaerota archaeon]MDG7038463.1 aspartate carbamoyltransferase [Nitrososphaerota archaeon]MDG7041330.1 aspartate carbamoyltransferase [Nitrososphaerota archaeon]MDG7043460.1 aspartate carbamoyltransferase [Nitrososphaerota archaeon]
MSTGRINGDIISAKQFTREQMERLFDDASALKPVFSARKRLDDARGRIIATVFMEPSTRTRLSFQFAGVAIGASVIDFGSSDMSSIAKGETFEDTMRMIDDYGPDVIVLRQRVPGNAARAADMCDAPVINAGDGSNEHPTQALLDTFTMRELMGKVDGLTIGMMGDLRYGRTTSSLSYVLDKFDDVTVYYIAPQELKMREEVTGELHNLRYESVTRPDDIMEDLDVLYVTRLQKERFTDPSQYDALKGSYSITVDYLRKFKKVPIIMHPLPRIDELSVDVDALPQAKYFEEARNGLYVRAALLKQILNV